LVGGETGGRPDFHDGSWTIRRRRGGGHRAGECLSVHVDSLPRPDLVRFPNDCARTRVSLARGRCPAPRSWVDGGSPIAFARNLWYLYLCDQGRSGRGAAWLARYLGVVEVAGSNPVAPTKRKGPSERGFRWAFSCAEGCAAAKCVPKVCLSLYVQGGGEIGRSSCRGRVMVEGVCVVREG